MDNYSYINKILNEKNDPKLYNEIKDHFQVRYSYKDDYFLKAGNDLHEVGFINRGMYRYFYLDMDGNDITKYFSKENDFVLSFTALTGRKSPFFIQALEDCEILTIKTNTLKQLINNNQYWNSLYVKLLEISYVEKEEREADFLSLDASQRYLKLKERNPELIDRVQQQYIASFLGITPVSLSRIIKNLALIK